MGFIQFILLYVALAVLAYLAYSAIKGFLKK